MKKIEENVEFGLIDDDFQLLDDEELNISDSTSSGGISFESLIGDISETGATPIISNYSTQELEELEKMISSAEKESFIEEVNLDDNFKDSADDSEFINLDDDFSVEEPIVENVNLEELTPITVDIDDEDLEEIKIEEIEPMVEEIEEETFEPMVEEIEEETFEPVVEEVEEETFEPVVEEVEEAFEPVVEEVEEETFEPVVEETEDDLKLDEITSEDEFPIEIKPELEDIDAIANDANLDALFDKASKNAQEASNIFNQNLELRRQIDEKYNELLKLTAEQEEAKKQALQEIEDYKNEVYVKLKEQKTEVDTRIFELQTLQSQFETEKNEFVEYRKIEIEKIAQLQQEQAASFEKEKQEIASIEEKLVLRKNKLDEEREQLRLEKAQFEKDKKALSENLKKFNQLVDGFTNGIDKFSQTNQTNNLNGENQ